jgi:hypothetical protein
LAITVSPTSAAAENVDTPATSATWLLSVAHLSSSPYATQLLSDARQLLHAASPPQI